MSSFGGDGLNLEVNPILNQGSINRLRNSIQKSFTSLKITADPTSIKKLGSDISSAASIKLNFDPAQARAYAKQATDFFNANPIQAKVVLTVDRRGLQTNSITKAAQEITKVRNSSRDAESAVGSLSDMTEKASASMGTFAQRLGFTTTRLAAYLVPASLIFQATRGISVATRDIIEINRELTKLTQVLDGNSAQAEEIAKRLFDFGGAIGINGKELLATSVTLAQAGQLFANNSEAIVRTSEAIGKTQLLATFGNVADTTEGLIAILSQFNLTASDTNRILDITNELAKKFAVESSDIFKAVTSGGAAFAALGGSYEEFASIVTALRQQTRLSASTIGTGINTIVQRLFRPGSIEFLRGIGVNALDAEGNLRSFVDVITDVSNAVKNLDDVTKQVTFETLFGTRQGKLGIALTGDLGREDSIVRQSLAAADNAIGSANKDLEEGLRRVDAQIQRVATSFQNAFLEIAKDESFKNFVKEVADGLIVIADITKALSTTIVPSLISTGFFALLGYAARSIPEVLTGLNATAPGSFGQVIKRQQRARNLSSAIAGGSTVEDASDLIAKFQEKFPPIERPVVARQTFASLGATPIRGTNPLIAEEASKITSSVAAAFPSALTNVLNKQRNELSATLGRTGLQPAGGQTSAVSAARSFLAQEEAVGKFRNRLYELNQQLEVVNKNTDVRTKLEARNNELIARRNQALRDVERAALTPANADTTPLTPLQRELTRLRGQQTPQEQNANVIKEAQDRLRKSEALLATNRERLERVTAIDATQLRNEIQKVTKSYTAASDKLIQFGSQLDPTAGSLDTVSSRARALVRSADNVERTSNALSATLAKAAPDFRNSLVKFQALEKITAAGTKLDNQLNNITQSNRLLRVTQRGLTNAFAESPSDISNIARITTANPELNRINELDSRIEENRNRFRRANAQFKAASANALRASGLIGDEIKDRTNQIRQVVRDVIRPLRADALRTGDLTAYNAVVEETRRQLGVVRGLKTQQANILAQSSRATAEFGNLNTQLNNEQTALVQQRAEIEKSRVQQLSRQSRLAAVDAVKNGYILSNYRNIRNSARAITSSVGRFAASPFDAIRRNPVGSAIVGVTAGDFFINRMSGEVNRGESSFNNIDNILAERDETRSNLLRRGAASSALSFGAAGFFAGGPVIGAVGAVAGGLIGAISGASDAFEIFTKRLIGLTRQGIFTSTGQINDQAVRALNITRSRQNFEPGFFQGLSDSFVRLISPAVLFGNRVDPRRNRELRSEGEFVRSDEGFNIARQLAERIARTGSGARLASFGGQFTVGSAQFLAEVRNTLSKAGLEAEAIEAIVQIFLQNSKDFNQILGDLAKKTKIVQDQIANISFTNPLVELADSFKSVNESIVTFNNRLANGTERLKQLSDIYSGQGGRLFGPTVADRQDLLTNIDRLFRLGSGSDTFDQLRPLIGGSQQIADLANTSALADRISKAIFSALQNAGNTLADDANGNLSFADALRTRITSNAEFGRDIARDAFSTQLNKNISDLFKNISNSSTQEQIKSQLLSGLETSISSVREAIQNQFETEIQLREQFNARLKLFTDILSSQLELARQREAQVFETVSIRSRRFSDAANLEQGNALLNTLRVTPASVAEIANRLGGLRFEQAGLRANADNVNFFDPSRREREQRVAIDLATAEIQYTDIINQSRFAVTKLTEQFNKLNDAVRQNIANLQTTGRTAQADIFAAQQTLRTVSGGGLAQQLAELGLNPGVSTNQFLSGLNPNDPRVRELITRIANSPGEISRISQAAGVLPGATVSGVGRLTDVSAILEALRGAAFSGSGTIEENFNANLGQLKDLNGKTENLGQKIVDLQTAVTNANAELIKSNKAIFDQFGNVIGANFSSDQISNGVSKALKETTVRTKLEGEIGIEATITGLEAALNSGNVTQSLAVIGVLEALIANLPNTPANGDIIRSLTLTAKMARDKLKGNDK